LTNTDGVGVWPRVSTWMRDESRSRSGLYRLTIEHRETARGNGYPPVWGMPEMMIYTGVLNTRPT